MSSVLINSETNKLLSSSTEIVLTLSLFNCVKYAIRANRATMIIGLKKVIIINDLFFTLLRYSLLIIRGKWFILTILNCLNKNIINTWNNLNKMSKLPFSC